MTQSTEVAELPRELIAQFAEMVTIVPDFEPGGGADIIKQLLAATNLAELDAPWKGGRNAPIGPMLYVTGISKSPSDFPGGLPFYLVAECVYPESGEIKEYSIGGTMVVAQLVRALVLDEFPLAGVIVEKELKNRPGQSAQHFAVSVEDTDRVRKAMAKAETK